MTPSACPSSHAVCGLSGGVDSAVAAALVHQALGDRLTCIFVDHGLLRKGEREQVERDYVAATGIRLVVVDVADRFLRELDGVTDPEDFTSETAAALVEALAQWCAAFVAGLFAGLPAPEASDNPFGYKFSWSPWSSRCLKPEDKERFNPVSSCNIEKEPPYRRPVSSSLGSVSPAPAATLKP